MDLFLILVLGTIVAAISIFLGLGGGIVLIPLLPLFFDIEVHEAVATSVTSVALVVSYNTWRFHQQGLVEWKILPWVSLTSIVGSFSSAFLSSMVSEWALLIVLEIILLVTALKTTLVSTSTRQFAVQSLNARSKALLLIVSLMAGVATGLVGVGAGLIIVPALIATGVVSPKRLTPTSNANMVFSTWAACLGYLLSGSWQGGWQWGMIRWDFAMGLFIAAGIAQYFLLPLQHRLPFRLKSLLLGALLWLFVVKVFVQLMDFHT